MARNLSQSFSPLYEVSWVSKSWRTSHTTESNGNIASTCGVVGIGCEFDAMAWVHCRTVPKRRTLFKDAVLAIPLWWNSTPWSSTLTTITRPLHPESSRQKNTSSLTSICSISRKFVRRMELVRDLAIWALFYATVGKRIVGIGCFTDIKCERWYRISNDEASFCP